MGQGELRVVGEFPGVFRLGIWNDVFLGAWFGGATGAAAEALVEIVERNRPEPGAKRSYIHLVPQGMGLPDAAARSGFQRLMKTHAEEMACVAIIIEGTGFWASAMRNVAIGLRVVAPRSFAYRMFGSAQELLEWFPEAHAQHTGKHWTASALSPLIAEAEGWLPRRTPG